MHFDDKGMVFVAAETKQKIYRIYKVLLKNQIPLTNFIKINRTLENFSSRLIISTLSSMILSMLPSNPLVLHLHMKQTSRNKDKT